jgi:hypothetical protein
MSIESLPLRENPTPKRGKRRYVRNPFQPVSLVLLAVLILLGVYLRQYEPDYDQPARVALVSARQQLEDSYSHEQMTLKQMQTSHRDLQAAIDSLLQAEKIGSLDRQQLESLRKRLQTLQDPESLSGSTTAQLQQSYRDIESQLDSLIWQIESKNR